MRTRIHPHANKFLGGIHHRLVRQHALFKLLTELGAAHKEVGEHRLVKLPGLLFRIGQRPRPRNTRTQFRQGFCGGFPD